MVQVDTALVRIVLKHFKWDVEKLLQHWMEEGKEKVFQKAGVQLHDEAEGEGHAMSIERPTTTKDCEICFSEILPEEVRRLCVILDHKR